MMREEFLCAFHGGLSLKYIARSLDLSDEEMGAALLEASYNKADVARHRAERMRGVVVFSPPKPAPDKLWCEQCDRLVHTGEAIACWSKWCKAKDQAA